MLLSEAECRSQADRVEAVVLRDLHLRLEPELGFTARMLDVNVGPRFLTREEVEPEAPNPKNRRTHVLSIPRLRPASMRLAFA